MKIRALLTFDHEVHLGGVESYSRNLFDPTDKLLSTAAEVDVPCNFFTDILCAIRFREWDRAGFYDPYREQLVRALRSGHDVQLHIHPHWVDTQFADGTFRPSRNFALADFADAEPPNNIEGIVQRAYDALSALCREVDPSYRCIAYRAGGYNLAPSTDRILKALYDAGIRIDSSIAKGYYFKSALSEINYRRMPGQANWYVAPSGPLNESATTGLLEIPIAARSLNPLTNVLYRMRQFVFYRKIKNRRYRSGGYMIHVGNTSMIDKMKDLIFPRSAIMLGFDSATFTASDLMGILEHHVEQHAHDREIILSAISHPKVMGVYHRDLMAAFVNRARRRFGESIEFCTFRNVFDDLNLA